MKLYGWSERLLFWFSVRANLPIDKVYRYSPLRMLTRASDKLRGSSVRRPR
jgi:hypothetical protein